jgi:aryl-alcohol dehydrogenase-like predicted oxidoreductase
MEPDQALVRARNYSYGSRTRFIPLVFSSLTVRYLLYRSSLGLALAPWDVLASGRFRTDAEDKARQESGEKGRVSFTQDGKSERTEDERKMSAALEKVAVEVGAKSIQAGTYLVCPFLEFMNVY